MNMKNIMNTRHVKILTVKTKERKKAFFLVSKSCLFSTSQNFLFLELKLGIDISSLEQKKPSDTISFL